MDGTLKNGRWHNSILFFALSLKFDSKFNVPVNHVDFEKKKISLCQILLHLSPGVFFFLTNLSL